MYTFTPRRPVKSFQDLEVYQKLLAVSVVIAKRIKKGDSFGKGVSLIDLALDLPVKIATAHSLRFSDQQKAVAVLEEVMLGCNLLIVYLEQYRDIYNHYPVAEVNPDVKNKSLPKTPPPTGGVDVAEIESEFFEEQIRTLLTCRFKVMHLQMSWKKFMKEA